MGLKVRLPWLAGLALFVGLIYASFRHAPGPPPADMMSATQEERREQLALGPAPESPAQEGAARIAAAQASPRPEARQPAPSDIAQLKILDEVLAAKNDNDPRLDRELRHLTPAGKALLRGRYESVAAEKRNQRGTVVFLVGRELVNAEDVAFLHSVLNEPPCLSLGNCSKEEKGSVASQDHHQEGEYETTLAYPQLVALKSIEAYLNQNPGAALAPSLLEVLNSARHSPVRRVAALAERIAHELKSAASGG